MQAIKIEKLTKDYGSGRGIFDVTFDVRRGEVFGFLGPNGAGKTTTIRHLLGFSRAQSGHCEINGMDCWTQPAEIQKHLGYVPGEIALPDNMRGWDFIKMIAAMRKATAGANVLDNAKQLCEYFKFSPNANLKRMSKGTKQKIALVIAFMHDPDILILDEPTSGLDPLMQARFCELIAKKRKEGKTILMSSHSFDEVEKTCDRVAIIKAGKIIANVTMSDMAGHPEFMVSKFSLEKYFMKMYADEEVAQ